MKPDDLRTEMEWRSSVELMHLDKRGPIGWYPHALLAQDVEKAVKDMETRLLQVHVITLLLRNRGVPHRARQVGQLLRKLVFDGLEGEKADRRMWITLTEGHRVP